MQIRYFCPACSSYNQVSDIEKMEAVSCLHCKKSIRLSANEDFRRHAKVTQCVLCGKAYFYNRRDFSKALGCLILLAAIILSVWTYGISLAVAGIVDWFLFKRLKHLVVCYICDTEIKGSVTDAPEFDLHLHEKYKKERETWDEGQK